MYASVVRGSVLKVRGSMPKDHGSWLVASQGSWLLVSQGPWLMASHVSLVHGLCLLKAHGSCLKARGLFWLLLSFRSPEATIVHDGLSLPVMKWFSKKAYSCMCMYVCKYLWWNFSWLMELAQLSARDHDSRLPWVAVSSDCGPRTFEKRVGQARETPRLPMQKMDERCKHQRRNGNRRTVVVPVATEKMVASGRSMYDVMRAV